MRASWGGSCNEAVVYPSLRAVYLVNQKAGSRTLGALFEYAAGARGYLITLSLEGTPDDNKPRMRYNCTSVAALAGTEIGDNYTFFTFVRASPEPASQPE